MTAPEDEGKLDRTPFVLFWFSRVLSSLASQALIVSVQFYVYEQTGSAMMLGLIGLAQFLPVLLLTLIIGHVADRYDRRRIASTCQLIEGMAAATVAFGTYGGWLSEAGILALVATISAARAFEQPTMAALLPGLVPRWYLQKATAWSASANQAAQIIGPALGGVLLFLGGPITFATAAAAFLVASTLIAAIRIAPAVRPAIPLSVSALFDGLGFIWKDRLIFATLSLDLFAVLAGGAVAMMPIIASDVLHAGPVALGVLRSSPATGALLMSLVMTRMPLSNGAGKAMFAAFITFGLATLLFALSTNLILSVVALAIVGASDVVSVVVRSSLVQLRTPDELRGRVSAVNSLFIGASNQLGDFKSGALAAFIGAVPTLLIGGIATILVSLTWMKLFPELRRLRSVDG